MPFFSVYIKKISSRKFKPNKLRYSRKRGIDSTDLYNCKIKISCKDIFIIITKSETV